MKKLICAVMLAVVALSFAGCKNVEIEEMVMKIDTISVDITWENNNSVKDL